MGADECFICAICLEFLCIDKIMVAKKSVELLISIVNNIFANKIWGTVTLAITTGFIESLWINC
jgi:hypothetical protein